MKRFRKLFALLLALAFCCALLPVSAMAESYTYEFFAEKQKNKPWAINTIVIDFHSAGYLSCDGKQMDYGGVMTKGNSSDYDVMFVDRLKGAVQIRVLTSFLDRLSAGTHTFTVTDGPDKRRTFDIMISGYFGKDWPPATPTDLGGSDEPDEVLYIGGMKGAGVAETKGGKPAESAAAAALSAAQAQQVVILPEGAPAANPATGAAL